MTPRLDVIEMLDLAQRSIADTRDPSHRLQALTIASLYLPPLNKVAWRIVERDDSKSPATRRDQELCHALDVRIAEYVASIERLETLYTTVRSAQGRARFDQLSERLIAEFDALYAEMTEIIAR